VNLDGYELELLGGQNNRYYREILAAIKSQMDAMLSHNARVMFLRIDLHAREYSPDNVPLSRFMRKMKKRLTKDYGFTRIGHIWAREQETAKQQHWHLVLLLDASKVRHPKYVIELIEQIAERWDWPKPYTPENCYAIIRRDDADAYGKAFKRASYLAKERGKGHKAKAANDYNRSHIRQRCNAQGRKWARSADAATTCDAGSGYLAGRSE